MGTVGSATTPYISPFCQPKVIQTESTRQGYDVHAEACAIFSNPDDAQSVYSFALDAKSNPVTVFQHIQKILDSMISAKDINSFTRSLGQIDYLTALLISKVIPLSTIRSEVGLIKINSALGRLGQLTSTPEVNVVKATNIPDQAFRYLDNQDRKSMLDKLSFYASYILYTPDLSKIFEEYNATSIHYMGRMTPLLRIAVIKNYNEDDHSSFPQVIQDYILSHELGHMELEERRANFSDPKLREQSELYARQTSLKFANSILQSPRISQSLEAFDIEFLSWARDKDLAYIKLNQ